MSDPQKILHGTASCDDLVQCMLNLGELEMTILKGLVKRSPQRIEELSEEVERDKSIVYRRLQKLMACNLVTRTKKNLKAGGYYFIYSAVSSDRIKERMRECIETMYSNMTKLLDDFEI